jgi:hypothetical protein
MGPRRRSDDVPTGTVCRPAFPRTTFGTHGVPVEFAEFAAEGVILLVLRVVWAGSELVGGFGCVGTHDSFKLWKIMFAFFSSI